MQTTVQQRVEIHDRFQVEMKVEYFLQASEQTRYRITTYFFFPYSLGINEATFPAEEFYRRIQNYIRLKTPEFALEELLSGATSPLLLIEALMADAQWQARQSIQQRLKNQFRFLRPILHRCLSRQMQRTARVVQQGLSDPDMVVTSLSHTLATINAILARIRRCGAQIEACAVDTPLAESYRLTDEALSLVVEDNLFKLLARLTAEEQPFVVGLRQQLMASIQQEIDYRRRRGYPSILQPGVNDEHYLYRISALKKYTSSVLYLATTVGREGATVEQLLFAVAAGISMVFATVVAFYFQALYGNFTFPVFIALVVGYMFKDRIKELGRSLSVSFLRRRYYDRRIDVDTLDQEQRVGHVREKVVFLDERELPSQIRELRQRSVIAKIGNEGQEERILCYTRDVTLRTGTFQRIYPDGPPITGVSDIMRLDVRPFLHKMDEPYERRPYLDSTGLRKVKCPKVYYVNAITICTGAHAGDQIIAQRVVLTLNRKGVTHVEAR
ncbi:MAG: hypothetical protein R3C14_31675 [Caldilineaceae bacterium]